MLIRTGTTSSGLSSWPAKGGSVTSRVTPVPVLCQHHTCYMQRYSDINEWLAHQGYCTIVVATFPCFIALACKLTWSIDWFNELRLLLITFVEHWSITYEKQSTSPHQQCSLADAYGSSDAFRLWNTIRYAVIISTELEFQGDLLLGYALVLGD